MGNMVQKKNRVLDIFYRAMKGESLSVRAIADEYGVSTKSISRDLNEIKNFLSENRDVVGNTKMVYSSALKVYYLEFENFLQSKELMAIMKVMMGCRAFSKVDVLELSSKLKNFVSYSDRKMLDQLLLKEMYHYNEVKHDCENVVDNLWKLTRCIHEKIEISVMYYKMDRKLVDHRLKPMAIMFSDYYFYLIAYDSEKDDLKPRYYRVDRIIDITVHRQNFSVDKEHDFDEGELRSKIQFMFPGEFRRIKFEYTGPSVQAILDKIPTARVIDVNGNTKIVEADVYGAGVNMFLLSQGKTIKVLQPQALIDELSEEIRSMAENYGMIHS